MGFAVCYFDSLVHLSSSSSSSGLKFRNPVFSFSKVAGKPSLFIPRRELSNLAVSSTLSDGNPAPNGGTKNDPTDKKTSTIEGILAIFKQMGTSIPRERTRNSRIARDVLSAESLSMSDKDTTVKSVLEILRQAHASKQGKNGSKKKNEPWTRVKEENKEEFSSRMDAKPRPPSSFSRRSPIPTRNKVDVKSEALKNFEGMKVGELKQVAKSKGLKRYSKLTKTELLELLTKSC